MTEHQNIVLIGFMGCGKSTIGSGLADRIGYRFVDCDTEITSMGDMSIPQIFETYGEAYFRDLETTCIRQIGKGTRQVIATGGGAVKRKENIQALQKQGILIYLEATPFHIYQNVKDDQNRPLLQEGDKLAKIQSLLTEREHIYRQAADWVVSVTGRTVNEIQEEIIEKLKER